METLGVNQGEILKIEHRTESCVATAGPYLRWNRG